MLIWFHPSCILGSKHHAKIFSIFTILYIFSTYIHFMWSVLTYAEDGYPTDNSVLKGGYPLIYHVPSWFPPPPTSIPRNQCFPCVIYGFYEGNEPLVCGGVGHGTRRFFVDDAWFVERKMLKRHPGFVIPSSRSSVATWGSSGRKNNCIFSLLTENTCRGLTSMIFPEGRWLVVPVSSTAIALEIVHWHGGMCSFPIKHLDKSVFTELTAEEKSRLEDGLRFFREDECKPCPAQHCPSVYWLQHVGTMLTRHHVDADGASWCYTPKKFKTDTRNDVILEAWDRFSKANLIFGI